MLDKHFIEGFAKNIEDEINTSIKVSMEGVCKTIRSFAYDVIAREAPELNEEHKQMLLDEWIPHFNGLSSNVVKNGLINGIPSSMMFEMVFQFVSFGIGKMSKEEIKALEENIGTSWSKRYWDAFPIQIKKLVRAFIKNEISFELFNEKIKSLLDVSF
ncbi:MAG: hypothetical protein ACTTJ3_06670 [Treponema sp.]